MILMDTSIWIQLFSQKNSKQLSSEQLLQIAVCPPVIQEILQGIRDEQKNLSIQDSILAFECIGNPVSLDDYLFASEIYRMGREKGYTIRSSVDCLIAALAIRSKIPVWHCDRDFKWISRYTALKCSNGV